MMEFSPLDEEKYESIAVKMTYWKIFEYILEDFVSREDSKEMMKSTNLPVTVDVGQTVSTTGGPTAQTGTTTSSGIGKVQAPYTGDKATPGSKMLKKQHKNELESGGVEVEGFTASIELTAGF